ncbi:MAG: TPMT family class I SAM-dependent methyltransferase [Bdellovibrionaceae bacterium]|nr:TPMT family class I SAM-dependent methyltransferase [Pseudobdellovibrionaceae bacterium]
MNQNDQYHFVSIDSEGYPHFSGIRVSDPNIGREILEHIRLDPTHSLTWVTSVKQQSFVVEAFDFPYVIQHVEQDGISPEGDALWKGTLPYQISVSFKINSLTIDEWDRLCGVTYPNNIPFVLSRKAQAQLMSILEHYSDNQITVNSQIYRIPNYFAESEQVPVHLETFWTEKYRSHIPPGWELNRAHQSLPHILPQLKLPRSKVLILGCGSGNDAAFWASQGHLVTAVDFSPAAIELGQEKWKHLDNIRWICSDVFQPKVPIDDQSYDIIFEHTFFCAITPKKRNQLVTIWQKKLREKGWLCAILFCHYWKNSPPFGGSEYEYQQRLEPYFQFIYWQRLRPPLAEPGRLGIELFLFAQKK